MAQQTIPGNGILYPLLNRFPASITENTSALMIDATGEKIAFVGQVFNKSRATKSITKVGFKFGTVVKAGGSGLTVSLQNVNMTVGPPGQPDGTQDQTVAIANGDSGFTSNAWYQTDALSASRSTTFGEFLSVVIEYNVSGRLGSDSVILCGMNRLTSDFLSSSVLYTTSWAVQNVLPNIILEFTDGTFGTLIGAYPYSTYATIGYTVSSSPDEYCLEFSNPFSCKIDGAWVFYDESSGFPEIIIYEGTTPLTGGVVSVDNNIHSANAARMLEVNFSQEIILSANTTYRLGLRPTTGNSVSLSYIDVGNADHFQSHPGGIGFVINSRVDQGSWGTPTTEGHLWGYELARLMMV